MSGTAGLSSAKNRRSGNEVKIVGQNKQTPQQPQQKPQQQPQQNVQAPHPLVILQSHEMRLRQIEGELFTEENDLDKKFETHTEDYTKLKNEFSLFKENMVNSFIQKDIFSNSSAKNSQTDSDLLALHRRIDDLTKVIEKLTSELNSMKEHNIKSISDAAPLQNVQLDILDIDPLPQEEVQITTSL